MIEGINYCSFIYLETVAQMVYLYKVPPITLTSTNPFELSVAGFLGGPFLSLLVEDVCLGATSVSTLTAKVRTEKYDR